MPSNFTKNYSLSQWERSDKVLMDDFNADNAKIDAAFFNHPSAELIASVTAEEENLYLELDLSRVDWSRYMALVLIADTAEYNGFEVTMGTESRCVYMLSQSQSTFFYHSAAHLAYTSHITMLIPVFYNGGHTVSTISFGVGFSSPNTVAGFSCGGSQTILNQCNQILVRCQTKKFSPGDQAVLWGIK